jgi:hypothetical protein
MTEQPHLAGHETSDAKVRPIVLVGVALAVVAGLVCVLVYGIFYFLADHPAALPRPNPMAAGAPQIPPEPRIEEHPAIQLQDLRAHEDSILSTYGWSDKSAGIVRIPVDRAMELTLQRGFPTRKETGKK